MRILKRIISTVTQGIRFTAHDRGPVALTPIAERLAAELSLPLLPHMGFEQLTFRLQGECSNALPHRRGLQKEER